MHIPDGILTPTVCVATGVAAAAAVGISLKKVEASPSLRTVPLTAVVAGLIFAGQMVNFRIPLPVPVSGHLIGGVLAAVIAGPWAGCLAITLVLLVQALLYADGGWLSFGANVLNMGVVGSLGGYAVFDQIRRRISGPAGVLAGAVVAAWVSVLAASTLFCVEFIASHRADVSTGSLFALMTTYHSLIGVGEALITGLILSYVVAVRPDLVYDSRTTEAAAGTTGAWLAGTGRMVWTGVIAALVVAAFFAPFASEADDGLEAVAKELQFESKEEPRVLVLSEYELPIPLVNTTTDGVWKRVSVSLAGLLGTTVVLGLAFAFMRVVKRGPASTPTLSGS